MFRHGFSFAIFSITLFSALGLAAQTGTPTKGSPQPSNPCPQIGIIWPAGRLVKDGEMIGLSANVPGGQADQNATFLWSTSSGVITTGQGSRSITVDTSGAGAERDVRVELWVGGFPAECSVQAATSVRVLPPAAKAMEFGELAANDETDQLKAFASMAAGSPDNIYVFGYAGKETTRGYASNALKRIKTQLLESGLSYQRMAFIDGGYREQPGFEIWLVPVGADAPRAKPTLTAKEVTIKPAVPASAKKP